MANDYCRFVGSAPSFFSCALAGTMPGSCSYTRQGAYTLSADGATVANPHPYKASNSCAGGACKGLDRDGCGATAVTAFTVAWQLTYMGLAMSASPSVLAVSCGGTVTFESGSGYSLQQVSVPLRGQQGCNKANFVGGAVAVFDTDMLPNTVLSWTSKGKYCYVDPSEWWVGDGEEWGGAGRGGEGGSEVWEWWSVCGGGEGRGHCGGNKMASACLPTRHLPACLPRLLAASAHCLLTYLPACLPAHSIGPLPEAKHAYHHCGQQLRILDVGSKLGVM